LSKVKPRARRPLFTAISLSPVWMRWWQTHLRTITFLMADLMEKVWDSKLS
jgi:hypothetical protein